MTRSAHNRPGAAPWGQEARALLALSGPLVLTNVGQVAIHTTDVIMLGWLGAPALAAGSMGATLIFMLLIMGIGVVMATAPMVAQDLGRKPNAVREPRRTLRQGFWVSVVLGAPAMALLSMTGPMLVVTGQNPDLAAGAAAYVETAVWAFIPTLWFVCLRCFIAAFERPRAALVVTVIGIAVNAVGDYVLIFGALGLPALGLRGAGIATSLTNFFLFATLLAFVLTDRRFRRFQILGRFWRPDWVRFREMFRIGVPMGVARGMEVGLFGSAIFLMGLIGVDEVAAHQIALQCAGITFMVPMGLSQAATVRVGLAVGRGDSEGVMRAGGLAFAMGAGFMACTGILMVSFPQEITGLFLDLDDPANLRVLELAVLFLYVAAAFQIADGLQVIAAGALAGLKDTRVPMILSGIAYWLVGLGTCIPLAFAVGLGGFGIWIGLAVGLFAGAALLMHRFYALQGVWPMGLRRVRAAEV